MREETFQAILTDVAHSLKMHGFENIIFIGDSGGNQNGQKAVAEKLTAQWNGNPVVAHIPAVLHGAAGHSECASPAGGRERGPGRTTACTTARASRST